jgi:hypothetical protein
MRQFYRAHRAAYTATPCSAVEPQGAPPDDVDHPVVEARRPGQLGAGRSSGTRRKHLMIFAYGRCGTSTIAIALRARAAHRGTRGRERLCAARRGRNATSGCFRRGSGRGFGGSRKRRLNRRMTGPSTPCTPGIRRTNIPRKRLVRGDKADRQTTRWCSGPSCRALPPRPRYSIHTHNIGNPSTSSTYANHALQRQVTAHHSGGCAQFNPYCNRRGFSAQMY